MATNKSIIDLYELLPSTYRVDDAAQGYQLKALMNLMSAQANLVKEDISGLYDDLFIETCADWVIPYIGDLVATLAPITSARRRISQLISSRRRFSSVPSATSRNRLSTRGGTSSSWS